MGGAFALQCYTGIDRDTKDFDIFLRPADVQHALSALEKAGYQTELTFPHWLAKAFCRDNFLDLIFASGNGICAVDDEWFEYAVEGEVLGRNVIFCPAEEMIWSKAYVMERERFDGADVLHILRANAHALNWGRLLRRFGTHWRVLLSHLILFGFVYPSERHSIPAAVTQELSSVFQKEITSESPHDRMCQGTLLSREQYLPDIERWGYLDARVFPQGCLTPADVAFGTAQIESRK